MRHVIESVERGSAAYRHGLRAGDALISLNGEAIVDEIDYQALIAGSRVHAVVCYFIHRFFLIIHENAE